MKDLLLEIGTEEMPANIMPSLVNQFKDLAEEKLKEARLSFTDVKIYATPRRLTAYVQGTADRQLDEEIDKRGPSVQAAYDKEGNPSKALMGFIRGQKINLEDIEIRDDYVYAHITNKGKPAIDVLPEVFAAMINGLAYPRAMRWGCEEFKFLRPIRWLVALLENEIVPLEIAHVKSSNISRGHRFLCQGDVCIKSAGAYVQTMREAFVIVDIDERRNMIKEQLYALAGKMNGKILDNPGLLEEINFIVEYPTALCGELDKEFLKLPVPAVVTPMRDHQRYYPLHKKDGRLEPYFLTVRNGGTKGIENVKLGNERVLRARLEDAKFFFTNDRKKTLEEHRKDLTRINYQEGLGTMLDKSERLVILTSFLAKEWGFSHEEVDNVTRAAYLSKSDLSTELVKEFTELQGEMGREYAMLDGEKQAVADAIFEQYMPRFSGDILPKTHAGRALSIADKLDNLVAAFLRGLIPTGSQDPFALRRQTIGIIHILVEGKLHWNIQTGIAKALELLPGKQEEKNQVSIAILEFFQDRIGQILLSENIDYDVIDAVLEAELVDIYDVFLKAHSMVTGHIKEQVELRQAVTRLHNITKNADMGVISEDLFKVSEEQILWEAYNKIVSSVESLFADSRYADSIILLNTLTKPINDYLDNVMVMDKEEAVKQNRLALLLKVLSLFKKWGDFSKLV